MHIIRAVFLFIVFTVTPFIPQVFIAQAEAAAPPAFAKFISISDIHFDPFIGCDELPHPCPIINALRTADTPAWDNIFEKYRSVMTTRYHQDSDYLLLKSTLAELKTLNKQEKPAFVLLLGDYLAHHFPEKYKEYSGDESLAGYHAFVKKVMLYLSDQLNQISDVKNFYPVIGNNDSYDSNYNSVPHSQFLFDTAHSFEKLIKNKQQQKLFFDGFSSNGYYSFLLNPHSRLIVLNSVFFSERNSDTRAQPAAESELRWLKSELEQSQQQHQRVFIALHIPMGVDVFKSLKECFRFVRAICHPLLWREEYNQQFLALLQQYAPVIAGILPGHIHADAFQILYTSKIDYFIPVSYTPAISPIHGNNPGLKVFKFNPKTFDLIDFDTYFYPINQTPHAKWQKEYNFNSTYQADCKACSLISGMLRLTKDNDLAGFYKKYYSVGRDAQPITHQNAWMPHYWCAVHNVTWVEYQNCLTMTS
ncbi:MAG: cpdA 1, partial [Gammaproteobacteria bacterium]|nr:cpdA 1 [Gammaproteobacteria bacterium]